MGVYIKGMEMPKKGSWVTLRVFPDGQCFLYSWCGNDFDFMEHLTAFSVPPTGRLIDADAFLKLCMDYAVTPSDYEFCKRLEYALTKAPTIIPAYHIGDANEMVNVEEGET